jgi:diguanylate cyclase (GGDEF)-like protein/PAS domain S-box-containing protein
MREREVSLTASREGAGLLERALNLMPGSGAALVDRNLRIIEGFGEIFASRGHEVSDLPGRMLSEVFPGEPFELLEAAVESNFEGREHSLEICTADGTTWYRIETRPIFEGGEVVAAFGFATDITERKDDMKDRLAAERGLAEARTLFETAFTNAPNGMALIGLDGSFLRVNPAMSDLTGYGAEELTRLKVADIAHPDDMQEQVDLIRRALRNEFDSYSLEKRFTRKSGEIVWLVLAVSLVRGESGEPLYVVAQTTNISEHKQVEVDLRTEAGRDPLTGLANRRQLEAALGQLLADCREKGSTASLMLLDLDGLKKVNDGHGHETGDAMLRFVAGELDARIRQTDLAARLGGDEFVLVLQGVGEDEAHDRAVALMRDFDRLVYDPEGLALRCRASIGSASLDAATPSAEAVLREADLAMYEAKRDRNGA